MLIEVESDKLCGVEELRHNVLAFRLLRGDRGESLAFGEKLVLGGSTWNWFRIKKVIIIDIVDDSSLRMVDDDVVCGKERTTKKNRSTQMRSDYSTESFRRPTTVRRYWSKFNPLVSTPRHPCFPPIAIPTRTGDGNWRRRRPQTGGQGVANKN